MRATLALLTVSGALLATYGCRDATQVTFVLSTDAKITCGSLMGVRITVAGDRVEAERRASGDFVTATATCAAPASQDIGTLVVTPGSSNAAAVVVIAGIATDARNCNEGNKYAGCVVARRSLAFIDHVSSVVPVAIDPACRDVPCDVASTCRSGRCVTSQLDCKDDGSCSIAIPGPDDGDASVPRDGANTEGGGADGSMDGSGADASDATMPEQCRFTCADPGVPDGRCPAGQACCHALAGGSINTRCISRAGCNAGGGSIQPGTSVCCKGMDECPSGVCCGDRGYTYTVCRTACEATERRVCKSGSECGGCGPLGPPYALLMYCP